MKAKFLGALIILFSINALCQAQEFSGAEIARIKKEALIPSYIITLKGDTVIRGIK